MCGVGSFVLHSRASCRPSKYCDHTFWDGKTVARELQLLLMLLLMLMLHLKRRQHGSQGISLAPPNSRS